MSSVRRSSAFDMRLRDAAIVTAEECEKILCKIILILIAQGSHDAKVDRNVSAILANENIAGMHVGVKVTVAKYLGKEYFHTNPSQLRNIDPLLFERCNVTDGNAFDALHDHDIAMTVIPVDFWH